MPLNFPFARQPANVDQFLTNLENKGVSKVEIYPSHEEDEEASYLERVVAVEAGDFSYDVSISREPLLPVLNKGYITDENGYVEGYQQQVRQVREIENKAKEIGLNPKSSVKTKDSKEERVPLTEQLYREIVGAD